MPRIVKGRVRAEVTSAVMSVLLVLAIAAGGTVVTVLYVDYGARMDEPRAPARTQPG